MGKPKGIERDYKVCVTFSEEEKKALYDICKDEISISDAIRMMVMATANGWLFIPEEYRDVFNEMYKRYTE